MPTQDILGLPPIWRNIRLESGDTPRKSAADGAPLYSAHRSSQEHLLWVSTKRENEQALTLPAEVRSETTLSLVFFRNLALLSRRGGGADLAGVPPPMQPDIALHDLFAHIHTPD